MGARIEMMREGGRVFQAVRERADLWRLSTDIRRGRPRDYAEWDALHRWGKLPYWEEIPAGYMLRQARERAGLTQAELAQLLGTSQQAVSQAERWEANPTVAFIRRWARACGVELEFRFVSA